MTPIYNLYISKNNEIKIDTHPYISKKMQTYILKQWIEGK